MDPTDPAQGQETPPDQCHDITHSVKGRQRKKNTKYSDFQTENTRKVQQKSPRTRSEGKATSKQTPEKSRKPHNESHLTPGGDVDTDDKAPEEPNGIISEETQENAAGAKRTPARKTPAKKSPARKTPVKKTPAKKTPVKKTPVKKTPAKKTPAKKTPAKKTPAKKTPAKNTASSDGGLPSQEGEGVNAEKQENGTAKKHVRKRPLKELEPVTDPPREEVKPEPPNEPEEDEVQPGGRRRRGAAKAALKYLHILAKEVLSGDESSSRPGADRDEADADPDHKGPKGPKGKGRRGRKRKRCDSDAAEDEDFVPDVEEEDPEEVEEGGDEVDEDELLDFDFRRAGRSPASSYVSKNSGARTPNGLNLNLMKVVWSATETTQKFREEHYSSWEFPELVPSSADWHPVPQSDVEKYLPQELQSAAFSVSREGLQQEKTPPQRLSRFSSLPSHPQRWDMMLFAGGPIWALEWCPTPDGAQASQYVALACHRGMDDRHYVNKTYNEPALVQLWDVGQLQHNSRPESQPTLAYGLAQDKGFIWQIKWCPAGGWEPPSSDREAPSLPRLGLLAVATSTCVVTIYSLPHPGALHSSKKQTTSGTDGQQLHLYQANGVLTLKLGSFRTPRHAKSGQVLSMDWLPKKPHNIIAIGFYDGVVGLWDLSTKSALLRVREPDKSLSLLPYRSFLAHDHAVRTLAFCPASRHLLVTAGEDRLVKTWDLRRLWNPVTALKRYLTNEIHWPLNLPGFLLAQETAYTAKGTQGVHFFDHRARSYYAIPRLGTLWSVSYSDWLNTVVTSDSFGDLIFALLPQMSLVPQYIKRTIERRFPIYLTSLVPYDTSEGGSQEMGGPGEEGDAAEEKGGEGGGGGEAEGEDARSEGGNDAETERNGGGEGGGGEEEEGEGGGGGGAAETPPKRFHTYREAVKKYRLHMTDSNMLTFAGVEKRPVWKRMRDTEMKMKMNMDDMSLGALHKVRFNPNLCCQTWIVSGGQAGLVRLNCLKNLVSRQTQDIISQSQSQSQNQNQAQNQNLISKQDQDVGSKSQTEETIDQNHTEDTISSQTQLSALDPPKEEHIQTVIL